MNIIIPLVKNRSDISVEELISAQSMSDPSDFAMDVSFSEPAPPKEGDTRHSFFDGWQRFYGGEWINMSTWWKIKIKGL